MVLMALTPTNRVAMRTSLHTGLRLSDVLSLETAKLAPRFWVTEHKTGKRRMVGLPADLLRDLRQIAGKKYVFEKRGKPQQHRTRQAVWADVKRAAKAFRLPQNAAPHSFRKVYAVELMEKYGDIERVRRALNHRYASTTLIYALADAQLQAKFKKRRGRA